MIEERRLTGQGTQAARELQVINEFGYLEKTIEETSHSLGELTVRIGGVLRTQPEEAAKNPTPPDDTLVDMAARIRESRKQVASMDARIQSILRRLEI